MKAPDGLARSVEIEQVSVVGGSSFITSTWWRYIGASLQVAGHLFSVCKYWLAVKTYGIWTHMRAPKTTKSPA
jgi:hypothetical protein